MPVRNSKSSQYLKGLRDIIYKRTCPVEIDFKTAAQLCFYTTWYIIKIKVKSQSIF